MKVISSFVLEKTLIASLLLLFMASAVLANELSDQRVSDTKMAVDYLFGLNSNKKPEHILLDKYKEEFSKKAKELRKHKARLVESEFEFNRLDDMVWMHLVFTRTKGEPDMWVVLTAYFINDQIETIQMMIILKEAPLKVF